MSASSNRLVVFIADAQPPALRALLREKGTAGKERVRELLKLGLAAEAAGYSAHRTPAGSLVLAAIEGQPTAVVRPVVALPGAVTPATGLVAPTPSPRQSRSDNAGRRVPATSPSPPQGELVISPEAEEMLGDLLDSLA